MSTTRPVSPVINVISKLPIFERKVLVEALNGFSVAQIGNRLAIPFPDVKVYISSILNKMQIAQLTPNPGDGWKGQSDYYYDSPNTPIPDLGIPISTLLLLNFETILGLLNNLFEEDIPSGIEVIPQPDSDSSGYAYYDNPPANPPSGTGGGVGAGPGGGGGGGFNPGDDTPDPDPGSDCDGEVFPGGGPNPPNPTDDDTDPAPPQGPPIIVTPPQLPVDIFLSGFEFDVFYKPSLFLTEIEYSDEVSGIVLNYPPTPPIAKFYPIMNSQNKFMITIEPSVGLIREKPQVVYDFDALFFALVIQQQGSNDDKVSFKYQGDVVLYEMFRIEEEPTSYRDFIRSPTSRITKIERGENVMFPEFILPNKSYYYAFRARDLHSSISNPSPVFHVKLYSNDGVENLDVSAYEFKIPEPKKTASFKRFLQINPNMLQRTYSTLKDKLGLVDESVYDKDFLLKITSKHSGKTMDMIIRFNKTNGI